MKLLYYIPAFGEPQMDIKYDILVHNLKYIYTRTLVPLDLCISFYSVSEEIKCKLKYLPYLSTVYIYESKGVLTELFLNNPHNVHVAKYDYVFFVLDDVKIKQMDIPRMISIKEEHQIEVLSPQVINSTHWFMKEGIYLTLNNAIEVFFIVLTPQEFARFCSIHTVKNKWMWGVDFLFGFYKIKAGILHTCVVEHVLSSLSDKGGANELMIEYLKQHTPYTGIWGQIDKDYPCIISTINV